MDQIIKENGLNGIWTEDRNLVFQLFIQLTRPGKNKKVKKVEKKLKKKRKKKETMVDTSQQELSPVSTLSS